MRWLFVALMAMVMLLGMTAAAYADGITGTVTTGGTELEGIDVHVYDEYWTWIGTVTTDVDGVYWFTDLPADNYMVQFDPYYYNQYNGSSYVGEFYADQLYWDYAIPVTVEFGADTYGIDADLEVGGRIAGTVTENGAPLTDIVVSVVDPATGYGWQEWTWYDGTYSVVAPVGSYKVVFDPYYYNIGYGASLPLEYYDDVAVWDEATPVDVYLNQVTWDINADLGSTGGGGGTGDITGRVTDEFGTGLVDVYVTAWGVDSMAFHEASTDADGYYAFTGVQTDMSGYEVFFDPNSHNNAYDRDFLGEFYYDTYDYSSRTLVQPGWTGVDASLAEGGRITGTVTDAFGQAASGVYVAAQDWGDYYVDAWTDVNGDYVLHGTYPDKTVYVSFDPGMFNFDNGTNYLFEWWENVYDSDSATPLMGTASGIDAQLDEAVVLSGTVIDMMTGGPVPDVEVQVTDYDGGGWYGYAYTDENGYYEVNVPPNVDVRVYFDAYNSNWMNSTEYLSLYYNGSYMYDGAFRVSVGTDPVTVNQALPTGTSITGTVTTGGMEPGGYVWVEAYLQVDGVSAYMVSTQTQWDGTYDFGPLFPGEWKVRFFDYVYDDGMSPPVSYFGEWWDNRPDEASADLVWLDETGDAICDADLAGEATVSGRVVDDDGLPIPNAIVTVWDGSGMSGYDPGMSGYEGISGYLTDADGYFVVPAGMTGEVKVQVDPPWDRPDLLGVWYSDKYDFGSADPVPVVQGEDTSLGDIVLHRGGTISGWVTDELGNPLDGISVWLYGQTGGMSDYYGSTETMSGYYEFVGLPAMEAQLQFWPDWYNEVNDTDLLGEYYDNAPMNSPVPPTLLDVAPGVDLPDTNAELSTGTRIAGVVRDEQGDPVPFVDVSANTSDGWGYGSGYTDENGAYVIRGLYPGSYQVHFSPSEYNWMYGTHLLNEYYNDAHTWAEIDWVDVAAGAPRLDIDAVLEAGGWIEGIVTAGGLPAGDVQVDVFDPATGEPVGSGYSRADGTYSTSAIAEGEYLVRFDPWMLNDMTGTGYVFEYYDNARDAASASPVSVAVGNGSPGIHADLEVGGSLSGAVTDEFDLPLWGVTVTAYDADGLYAGETWADPDTGEWTIKALVPGDYTLEFNPWIKNLDHGTSYLREFWDDRATKAEADPIAVDLGDVLTVYDAQLVQGGGTIAGTITGPAGAPLLSDVWVHVYETTADGPAWFAYDVAPAPGGEFSISGVPAGTYYLWFEPDWMDYVDQVYDGKPMAGGEIGQAEAIARLATPVELTDGQIRDDITVELQTGSTISGSVVDPSDAGIPGVDVELFYSDGAGGWVPVAIETTDALGEFTFGRLLMGEYKVEYADGQAWYLDGADIDAADVVILEADSSLTLDPQQLPLPDVDPPTSTLTVTGGTMGQSGWYLAAPTLTLSADEPATLWYQWDGGMGLVYMTGFTPAPGEHTLTYWAVDLEGNGETPKQTAVFKFDDTAPSAPTGVTAAQTGAGEATVSWTAAADAESGIQRYVLYQWDGTAWQVVNHTIPATSTSYVVTGLPGGLSQFQVAAVNMPGLATTSTTAGVDIDTTAPTTTISVDPTTSNGLNGWYITNPVVSMTADDPTAVIWWRYSTGDDSAYAFPILTGQGERTVLGYAVDEWGNTETPEKSVTVKADLTAPSTVTDLAATVVDSTTVSLTWTHATDGTSGLWRYAVRNADDDSTFQYETGNGAEVGGLAPDTDYTLYILAQDNAGWYGGESNHVTIHTPPLNTRPVAVDDAYTMAEDTVLTVAAPGVLGNDTDADSDALTASFDGDATHGEVTLNADGSFTYTPDADWFGIDSFDYVALDGNGGGDGATVTITVTDVAEPPTGLTVTPIAGANRIGTAIAASVEAFADDSVKTVVIATALNWPDALGGAALAGAVDGPILLTNPTALAAEVTREIDRLGATKAYILGGTAAVGANVETALKAKLGAANVERIAGTGRYETARKIAAETVDVLGSEFDGTAFVATGLNFPDALGASPLAAAKGWPIYLVGPTGADATLTGAMKADGVTEVLVLGGPGVVSERVKSDIAIKVPAATDRLAGDNRYATAIRVATYGVNEARLDWDKVAIATGANFPDALAGGVLQGKSGSVMLLTPSATLNSGVATTLTANKLAIHEVRFLGGMGAVSQPVRDAVVRALR